MDRSTPFARARLALAIATPLVLVGCGGDDGGEVTTPPPSPTPQVTAETTPAQVQEGSVEAESFAACLTENGYPAEVDPEEDVLGIPGAQKVLWEVEGETAAGPAMIEISAVVFPSEDEAVAYAYGEDEEARANVFFNSYSALQLKEPAAERANDVVDQCIEGAGAEA